MNVAATITMTMTLLAAFHPMVAAAERRQPMGLAYDPEHSIEYPANVRAIFERDFNVMVEHGFEAVRTYRTIFNNVQIAPYANQAGLHMALGVMLSDANYDDQIQEAIRAAQTFPTRVKFIFIGNEDLNPDRRSGITTDFVIAMINRVKQAVQGTGVKVGTVQRTTEWVQPELMDGIAQASDVLGVNVYAFFTPNTAIDNALQTVKDQMEQIGSLYATPAMITETGWASDGDSVVGNLPSPANHARYFTQFFDSFGADRSYPWSSTLYYENYYFQFCDPTYKATAVERSFGLFESDNSLKLSLQKWMLDFLSQNSAAAAADGDDHADDDDHDEGRHPESTTITDPPKSTERLTTTEPEETETTPSPAPSTTGSTRPRKSATTKPAKATKSPSTEPVETRPPPSTEPVETIVPPPTTSSSRAPSTSPSTKRPSVKTRKPKSPPISSTTTTAPATTQRPCTESLKPRSAATTAPEPARTTKSPCTEPPQSTAPTSPTPDSRATQVGEDEEGIGAKKEGSSHYHDDYGTYGETIYLHNSLASSSAVMSGTINNVLIGIAISVAVVALIVVAVVKQQSHTQRGSSALSPLAAPPSALAENEWPCPTVANSIFCFSSRTTASPANQPSSRAGFSRIDDAV